MFLCLGDGEDGMNGYGWFVHPHFLYFGGEER